MKKFYLLLLLVTGAVMAQIPQGFSYQAVALNTSGQAVASAPVKIRLSILDNNPTGTAVYTETHNPTTNSVGLFNLTIGQGTTVTGSFSTINWAQNSKFLKVEIDVTNGTNYVTVGSSQLLTVPYAMVAGTTLPNYLPATTHASRGTEEWNINRIRVSGFIMPTSESLSYTESGFIVGTSPNVTYQNSIYHEAGDDYGSFVYAVGGSFSTVSDLPVSSTTLYIKVYAKKASGEYLYGNEVSVIIP